jgi:hypothetical protein
MANPRDFHLSRRDLTCGLPALVCAPERPFMAGQHATKEIGAALCFGCACVKCGPPKY